MNHDQLIGLVQDRARLSSRGDAEVAVRATLSTLEERLTEGAFQNLVAQLPKGIGDYHDFDEIDLREPGERFDVDEFLNRVARREGVRKQDAAFHVRCVLEVLEEATTGGVVAGLDDQLPDEYNPLLFSGSKGDMKSSGG